MAVEICNIVNKTNHPNKFEMDYKVCKNTFMSTLQSYTDFESKSILRQKAGKKDKASTWAVARMKIAKQMLDQIPIGKSMDNGILTLHETFEKVENNDLPPPSYFSRCCSFPG
jgi:hypothetical protein